MVEAGVALSVAGAMGGVALGGLGVGRWVLPGADGWVRWTVGMAAVLGAWVVGGWWLAWLGRLDWVVGYGVAVMVVSGVSGVVRGVEGVGVAASGMRGGGGVGWIGGGGWADRDVWGLLTVLVVAGGIRLGLALTWTLPPGWDPSFHLLLADRVAESGGLVTTWEPYEPVRLHYPLAAHVLLAAVVGREGLGAGFGLMLAWLATLLVALSMGAARAVGLPTRAVVLTGVLMGLGTWMGSLGYLGWGGLPNLMGVCLMMGLLIVVVAGPEAAGRWTGVWAAILGAGMVLSHHHVMVSGAMAVLAAVVSGRRWGLLPWGGLGLAMSAGGWGRLAGMAGGIGETAVHRYTEELLTPWRLAEELGWGLSAALVLSVLLVRRGWPGDRVRGRMLSAAVLTLVGLWVGLDYGCRVVAWGMGWEPMTLLTPSRFLTNSVPMLAVVAGAGVSAVAVGRWGPGGWAGVVVVAGLCAGLIWERYRYLYGVDPVPRDWVLAARWVAGSAPRDVLVLNGPTVHPGARSWLSFLTRRATTYTPIPTSEPLARLPSVEAKVAAAREVWDLREARWVNPEIHEVLHVSGDGGVAETEGGGGEAGGRVGGGVAVSRVRRQDSAPRVSQP